MFLFPARRLFSSPPRREQALDGRHAGPPRKEAQGKSEVKLLDFTVGMNQYAGDFALSEKGRYQVLILFKSGEKKHAAGFYYALK